MDYKSKKIRDFLVPKVRECCLLSTSYPDFCLSRKLEPLCSVKTQDSGPHRSPYNCHSLMGVYGRDRPSPFLPWNQPSNLVRIVFDSLSTPSPFLCPAPSSPTALPLSNNNNDSGDYDANSQLPLLLYGLHRTLQLH